MEIIASFEPKMIDFIQKQAVCLNKNDPKSQLVSHSCQIKTIRLRNYVDFFIPFCELSVKIPNVDKSEAKLKCYQMKVNLKNNKYRRKEQEEIGKKRDLRQFSEAS